MSERMAVASTLSDAMWKSEGSNRLLRGAVLALAGSVLLAISAKIQVPFWPVPQTMQTLVVLMIGMSFGSRLALATVLLYLAEGAAGLPVFAGTPEKGIGLAYMMGPTGGYLLGFALAAGAVGWLAERGWDRSIVTTAAAMAIGNVLIYLPGVAWLSVAIGFDKAVLYGMQPFLLGDAAKLALAAFTMPMAWKLLRRG